MSQQKYEDTVVAAAQAFGVSPSAVSDKITKIIDQKLKKLRERSLKDFRSFAIFTDTIHRGSEAFIVALAINLAGDKLAFGKGTLRIVRSATNCSRTWSYGTSSSPREASSSPMVEAAP